MWPLHPTGGTNYPPLPLFENERVVQIMPDQTQLTTWYTERAVKFIDRNKTHPFFLYVPHNMPHVPLHVSSKFKGKSGRGLYADVIMEIDWSVGEILAALKRNKLDDNTLVIFTSDNGGLSTAEGSPTSNAPLRAGKGWLYEGGVRVPLLVKWPGVTKPGATTDTPAISTDIFPTLLEAAGLPARPQAHVDGVSLMPVLRGGQLPARPFFWHYPHYGNQGGAPAGGVREGDWKLIEWFEDNRVELFNLKTDLGEQNNLAGKEPEKVKALQARLAQWRRDVGARMPTPNPNRPGAPGP
jgi:arylsulfatase A-like enzyme